ncbi:MAG: hypothetical protein K6B52_06750 [Clostridiales bacterium]|nr:hypothetical protein [Clostridiales bacterium]
MKNPRTCRLIGYIILFAGFGFVIAGSIAGNTARTVLYLIAGLFIAASVVWMIKKVRCPHCGALLHLKFYDISTCQYCHKRTDC